MNQLAPVTASHAPALIAMSGPRASYRFLEFFTAQIRNPHTRRAYARAPTEFFDWLEARGVTQLAAIESVHVATYIEQLSRARSAPTVGRPDPSTSTGDLLCPLKVDSSR
jgi:hypothetical protein